MSASVQLVPHDPAWQRYFDEEAAVIRRILDPHAVAIHHIGSTAIPGIWAKPVVDILCSVDCLDQIQAHADIFKEHDYMLKGDNGIVGRQYLKRMSSPDRPEFHIHVYRVGDAQLERHLAFRDYMLAHPVIAAEYSSLKRSLRQSGLSRAAYQEAKAPFVAATEKAALHWHKERRET